MLVQAMKRGQLGARTIEPGESFECPDEHLALCMIGPAGESLGWMEPARSTDRPAADAHIAEAIARSANKPSNPHEGRQAVRAVRVTLLTPATVQVGRHFNGEQWVDVIRGEWFPAGTVLDIPENHVTPSVHFVAPADERDPADIARERRAREHAASPVGRIAALEAASGSA
jgi:hypothetical protein